MAPNSRGVLFVFLVIGAVATVVLSYLYEVYCRRQEMQDFMRTVKWLKENGLEEYKDILDADGSRTLAEVACITKEKLHMLYQSGRKQETNEKDWKLLMHALQLKRELILCQWLTSKGLGSYCSKVKEMGISNMRMLIDAVDVIPWQSIFGQWYERKELLLRHGVKELQHQMGDGNLDSLPVTPDVHWTYYIILFCGKILLLTAKAILLVFSAAVFIVVLFFLAVRQIFQRFHGNYTPHSSNSPSVFSQLFRNVPRLFQHLSTALTKRVQLQQVKIDWHWEGPCTVGEEKSFTIKFYRNNFILCDVSSLASVKVEIIAEDDLIHCTLKPSKKQIDVYFTPTVAGDYKIAIHSGGRLLEQPTLKTFLPGPVDAEHTTVGNRSSYAVMRVDQDEILQVQLRDKYQNNCEVSKEALREIHITVDKIGESNIEITPELQYFVFENEQGMMMVKLSNEGCYKVKVYYRKNLIRDGEIVFIVLSGDEWSHFNEICSNPTWNRWFECYLVPYEGTVYELDGSKSQKRRKVYTYLTPKCEAGHVGNTTLKLVDRIKDRAPSFSGQTLAPKRKQTPQLLKNQKQH